MEIGQLVKSLAGRDKGKHYLVTGFDGNFVLLSDGQVRLVTRPKRKNTKHLQPYRCVVPQIQEEIQQKTLKDTMVRNTLNALLASEGESTNNDRRNTPHSLWLSSSHGG